MNRCLLFLVGLLILLPQLPVHAEWATLSGQFLFGVEGTQTPTAEAKSLPQGLAIRLGVDTYKDSSLLVNPDNRGIENVLIWVYRPKEPKIHPDYAQRANAIQRIDFSRQGIRPYATMLRAGQTLEIRNADKAWAHAPAVSFIKNPPLGPVLPAAGVLKLQPTRAEPLPLSVTCSVHAWERALLLVQGHPYMAATDEDGKFQLKHLPATEITLRLWHEKLGYIQTATIDGAEQTIEKGRLVVDLSDGKSRHHEFVLPPKLFLSR